MVNTLLFWLLFRFGQSQFPEGDIQFLIVFQRSINQCIQVWIGKIILPLNLAVLIVSCALLYLAVERFVHPFSSNQGRSTSRKQLMTGQTNSYVFIYDSFKHGDHFLH